jgi:TolB-like protein
MADQSIQRRLAAVLAADVAGYTRLMEEDTEGTVAAWQAARADIIRPTTIKYSGKLVKLTGDGFLIEFPTVQDAVKCAIAMQQELTSSSLDFRIGINLGDIIDDGEDIHGEGVNVAARLEGLAEPGGICISGDVYNQVRNRVDADYQDMGPQAVKNVSAPVQAYAVNFETAVDTGTAKAPDKPSIAVLPFDNLSGDPEQEYFSDGITEDIITALSRIRQFFVIARNTTFTYKGQAVDVLAVARDLGVRYVLEGSVRKSGERVRITAQLIDGATGNHLWAERYDRNLEDIFEVRDEITQTVVGALGPELSRAEQDRARRKPPDNLNAWDLVQRGLWRLWRFNEEDNTEAIALFKSAIEADSDLSSAYSGLSYALIVNLTRGYTAWSVDKLEAARAAGRKAVDLDGGDAFAHWALGTAYTNGANF